MHWILIFVLLAKISASPEENIGIDDPNLFEGDMILTPEQRLAALRGTDISKAGGMGRGSMITGLWPGGVVYYTIEKKLSDDPVGFDTVKKGIAMWETTTCLRFLPRMDEKGYIRFYRGAGCKSAIGYKGRKQSISLSKNCWRPGIAAHEIAHALGFYHEQSRPDRDDYVIIHWDNIRLGMASQFQKYDRSTIDSLGTPYDYESIMHYSRKAFGQGKITIEPKTPGVKIGQRSRLSKMDILQMNLLYNCPNAGTRPPRTLPARITTTGPSTRISSEASTSGPTTQTGLCRDKNKNCHYWLNMYKCDFSFVKINCRKTCKDC